MMVWLPYAAAVTSTQHPRRLHWPLFQHLHKMSSPESHLLDINYATGETLLPAPADFSRRSRLACIREYLPIRGIIKMITESLMCKRFGALVPTALIWFLEAFLARLADLHTYTNVVQIYVWCYRHIIDMAEEETEVHCPASALTTTTSIAKMAATSERIFNDG